MKYYILKQLTQKLNSYKNIKYIKRVENNTIKIEFNDKNIYYFNLTRGDDSIYKKNTNDNIKKDFNAPFDVILRKKFTNANIANISLLNDDKIILFKIENRSSYKKEISYLHLEFTGKNTNIIVTDENNIIIEALRHIDEWSSTRVIQVGKELEPLEKPNFNYEDKSIENIDEFLYDTFNKKETQLLNNIKKQKITQIDKSMQKISDILKNLDDIIILQQKADDLNSEATTIVSNLYKLNGYEKNMAVINSNKLFRQSKKMKQKIKNQHIEESNLKLKLKFYERLKSTIQKCTTIDEIEFYIPKKDKNQKKTKKEQPYQSFFIDGYKIMLGRDERENIYLLQNSKASDFWFHLQGQVSAHVIVSNRKKTIPEHIIIEAAKICAKFSTSSDGVFTVDYTQRRNVKIQNRANVLYNPYTSIEIKI